MAHRFGEFFLDPEWPFNNDENNPHLANLDNDYEQDPNICKQAESEQQPNTIVKIEHQECRSSHREEESEDHMVIIKQEELYESSQEESSPSDDSSYSQDLFKKSKIALVKLEHTFCVKKQQVYGGKVKQIARNPLRDRLKRKRKDLERGRYKILSEELKKQIVDETKSMTMVEVARKYHVSVNNICRWRKRCDRRTGAGRKVTDMEMETRLLQWLQKQNNPIARKQVQMMARRMSKQEGFKASKGWFERFYKRNRLDYNPNIEILTYNDYRQRLSRLVEDQTKREGDQAQNEGTVCKKQQ